MAARITLSSSLNLPISASSSAASFPRHCSLTFSSSPAGKRLDKFVVGASPDDDSSGEDTGKPAFNPFGFVTDNPSSRSAIQLPESPAEDGNVGQMLYVCESSALNDPVYQR